jgi:hypothetical protein
MEKIGKKPEEIAYKMLMETLHDISEMFPELPVVLMLGILDLLKDEIKLNSADA